MAADINYKIFEFVWSGSNSIRERAEAARLLAVDLARQGLDYDEQAVQLVIGHSHGGNIALSATNILSEHSWSKPNQAIHVATIATPFVRLSVADSREVLQVYGVMSVALTAFLLSLMYFQPDIFRLMSLGVEASLQGDYSIAKLLLKPRLPTESTFLALAWIAQVWGTWLLVVKNSWLRHILIGDVYPDRAKFLEKLTGFDVARESKNKILVLRGPDDEAAAVLTFGGLGVYLSHLFIRKSALWVLALCLAIPVLFSFLLPKFSSDASIEPTEHIAFQAWSWMTYLLGLYAMILVTAQVCRSVYGRELLFGAAYCEVTAHSTPDFSDRVEVVTLSNSYKQGLRHSLYDNVECPSEIVSWLRHVGPRTSSDQCDV